MRAGARLGEDGVGRGSPQSTVTCHGESAPGSVKLPRLKLVEVPSLAVWSAGAVTTGMTLATVTWKVLARLLAPVPFSSTTVRVTV